MGLRYRRSSAAAGCRTIRGTTLGFASKVSIIDAPLQPIKPPSAHTKSLRSHKIARERARADMRGVSIPRPDGAHELWSFGLRSFALMPTRRVGWKSRCLPSAPRFPLSGSFSRLYAARGVPAVMSDIMPTSDHVMSVSKQHIRE